MYERQDILFSVAIGIFLGLILGVLAGSQITWRIIDGDIRPIEVVLVPEEKPEPDPETTVIAGGVIEGLASWYGEPFHGRTTASGEVYDLRAYTAASRTLRLNTLALVECLETGKRVIVRVTDRGPYIDGRVIDLSWAAASRIGMVDRGVSSVRVIPIEIMTEKLSEEE